MQEILSKKLLGERIKSLRLEKSYPQAHVADILNLSRSNYSQIELGNQYPTFNTLNALSRHYNKTYEWLLHGEESQEVLEVKQLNVSLFSVVRELELNLKQFSVTLRNLEQELDHLKNDILLS